MWVIGAYVFGGGSIVAFSGGLRFVIRARSYLEGRVRAAQVGKLE